MTDYLLDTNHLNRLIDPRHPLRALFVAHLGQGDAFSTILLIITEACADALRQGIARLDQFLHRIR